MNPPEGLGIKINLVLLTLYADQYNLRITGTFEYDGVIVEFDTDKPVSSFDDEMERYRKIKSEREKKAKSPLHHLRTIEAPKTLGFGAFSSF